MSAVKITSLLLIIFTAGIVCSGRTYEMKMINDYVNHELLKSTIFHLCWEADIKLELLKSLIENNHSVSMESSYAEVGNDLTFAHTNLHVLDLKCNNSGKILNQANENKLFTTPYKWLLLSDDPDLLRDQLTEFRNYDIYPNSNLVIAQKTEKNEFILTDIYRYSKSTKELIIKQIANWTEERKFRDFKPRILARERQDMQGTLMTFCIVILDNDTLNHLEDFRFNHIDPISKTNYIFLTHMVDFMNITYSVIATDSWGYDHKTGLVGYLVRGDVDMAGTSLYLTHKRLPWIDFASVTTSASVRFVFRQPPLSYESNIFTLPFTRSLWIGSFSLLLLISVLLYYAVLWEWKNVDLEVTSTSLEADFMEVVMLQVGGVAQQGANFEPRGGPGKIIMIFSYIALMFLYVSYSANIVALLQSSATNINTLQDLLSSRMKLGIHNISYNVYYFTTATDPIRKAIYERKIAPPGQKPQFFTLEDGIQRIREGFFAFHLEVGPAYKVIGDTFFESEKCNLQEMKYFSMGDTYLPMRKDTPYKEIIKNGYRRILENGLQSRVNQRIYTAKPKCNAGGGSFVSVGLIDSYPAFLVFGIGIAASFAILILEIIVKKHCNYAYFQTG